MTAQLLDGKATAAEIRRELAERVAKLTATNSRAPGLGTVLVGDDPGSHAYVAGKHRDCAQIGIASIRRDLPPDATQQQVEDVIDELNADPACTGYIVQLPLPSPLDASAVLERMDPAKDADGLHPVNLGRLTLGVGAPLPCTPRGIVELLRRHDVPLAGACTPLAELDPQVHAALRAELHRQQSTLEMIASENFAPLAVMEAQGSVLTNKYAEGYPGRRYYGGCEHVDVTERLAIQRVKDLFGAGYANVQSHSGAQANTAVFFALLKPGDTVLGHDLAHGGHLTHGMRTNYSGRMLSVVPYHRGRGGQPVHRSSPRAGARWRGARRGGRDRGRAGHHRDASSHRLRGVPRRGRCRRRRPSVAGGTRADPMSCGVPAAGSPSRWSAGTWAGRFRCTGREAGLRTRVVEPPANPGGRELDRLRALEHRGDAVPLRPLS